MHYLTKVIVSICILVLTGCSFFSNQLYLNKDNELTMVRPVQCVDTALIILDATDYNHQTKMNEKSLKQGKKFLLKLNTELEKLNLTTGFRVIGGDGPQPTRLIYGMSNHSYKAFEIAVLSIAYPKGQVRLCAGLKAALDDSKTIAGDIAIIFVSNGMSGNDYSFQQIKKIKTIQGKKIYFFPVITGNDKNGKQLLEDLVAKLNCGEAFLAKDISSSKGMATFIDRVFYQARSDINNHEKSKKIPPSEQLPENHEKPKIIYFDLNSDMIQLKYFNVLDQLYHMLQQNSMLHITIQGHTDDSGTEAYNQDLSEKRALAVKKYLHQKGVESYRMSTQGFSSMRPLYPNTSPKNKELNRRVEIIVAQ